MATYTETDIANLIERFNTEAPAPVAPVKSRRTAIVADVPASGFNVTIAGYVFTVDATGPGEAILTALAASKAAGIFNLGAYVFLLDYAVTDSDGVTYAGTDMAMRNALESARIASKRPSRG